MMLGGHPWPVAVADGRLSVVYEQIAPLHKTHRA